MDQKNSNIRAFLSTVRSAIMFINYLRARPPEESLVLVDKDDDPLQVARVRLHHQTAEPNVYCGDAS